MRVCARSCSAQARTHFCTCHPNIQHTLESYGLSRAVKIVTNASGKLSSEMENTFQVFMKKEL